MEKKEKRPGYFTRLKKKRHLKHTQTEKADAELDQSEAESGATPVCTDAVIGQALEKNPESGQSTSRSEGSEDAGRRSRRRERRRPSGTAEYLVGPSDTLNSVALKFNITPNNLVHLNRLFSHSLVPGQTLFVPDVDAVSGSSQDTSGCDPASVLPACRGASPPSEDESPSLKFIKMSCKYFTDGMGVVGGVMIVTPNNIMFDPHKSDPLVIEHGCEEYGLLCPMEEVLSIALYDDVSRMKLKDTLPSDEPRDLCPLYRPCEWEELPSERDLNPFSRFQAPPHGPAPDQSPSDEGFTELELPPSDCPGACPCAAEEDEDEGLHNRSTEETPGVEVEDSGKCSPKESEGPSVEAERRRRASEAEMKSWLLKRMQGPIENLLLSAEQKSKAPPMFLCFKVGKPMIKSFAIGQASSPALSWACQGRQAEYWFAVPQERVEQLYSFFIQWSPDAYGKEALDHGFVVVDKDELPMIDNFFSDPLPRSWEIITINEAKRRQSFCLQDEEPLDLLPVLLDTSALLQDTHLQKLAPRLPARVLGRGWRVIYSTEVHGTSLKTLYRCSADLEEPVLLVIRDMNQQVFGAFSTHPFRVSEHCYGTGETFLYSFCPEIKVFRWTGENSYFVKGNTDSVQIGGGGGRLGLWLDADLHHGTTSRCSTFNNPPLTDSQDFTVQNLEVWTFE